MVHARSRRGAGRRHALTEGVCSMSFTKFDTRQVVILAVLAAGGLVSVTPLARADDAGTGKVALVRTPEKGVQPQAVMDGKGVLHLIYFRGEPGNGDVFYVHSNNGGKQ